MSGDIRLSHGLARSFCIPGKTGEAIVPAAGKPAPSFYVTESRDLPLDVIDLCKYRLRVGS